MSASTLRNGNRISVFSRKIMPGYFEEWFYTENKVHCNSHFLWPAVSQVKSCKKDESVANTYALGFERTVCAVILISFDH